MSMILRLLAVGVLVAVVVRGAKGDEPKVSEESKGSADPSPDQPAGENPAPQVDERASAPEENGQAPASGGSDGAGANADCGFAVSKVATKKNSDCKSFCETDVNGDNFKTNCILQKWSETNGNASVDPNNTVKCFNNYIFGFDESMTNSNEIAVEDAESPVICQLSCQNKAICAAFHWKAVTKQCLMKKENEMKGASDHVWRESEWNRPEGVEQKYCNQSIKCSGTGMKSCQKCPADSGDFRCIFSSSSHISGPKYCTTDQINVCRHVAAAETKTETEKTDATPKKTSSAPLSTSFSTTSLVVAGVTSLLSLAIAHGM